jgi:integrase/recombinase XerD
MGQFTSSRKEKENVNEKDLAKLNPEQQLTQLWGEAFDLWLANLTDSTRRSYRESWKDFMICVNKMPWKIGRSDVARWAEAIRERGLSACTKNLKLSAISSFFKYVCTEYTVVNADGNEVPLHSFNPAGGKSLREKVNPYGKADSLSPAEVQALLSVIPRDSVLGLRDFAMILAYLYTGRRNSEIRKLRWGSIEQVGDRYWYVWSGKGKNDQRYEMPCPVYEAIVLRAASMLETIKANDFIFVAVASPNSKPGQPLSMREVGRMLKKYAKAAGLDDEEIHVHTLRHTAAMLRRQVGDRLEQVSAFLGHSNIATTQIYLDRVAGKPDQSWEMVKNLIGNSGSS